MVKDPDDLWRAILIYVEVLFSQAGDKPAFSIQDGRVQHDQVRHHVRRLHGRGRHGGIGCQFSRHGRNRLVVRIVGDVEHLAARTARHGAPEQVHLDETDTSLAIEWKGQYRIEGPAFVCARRDTGRVTAILGHPTQSSLKLVDQNISNMFG